MTGHVIKTWCLIESCIQVYLALSFVILNLPSAVASTFFPETESCSTQGGITIHDISNIIYSNII